MRLRLWIAWFLPLLLLSAVAGAQTCAQNAFIRSYKGVDNHFVQQAFRPPGGDLQIVGNTEYFTNGIKGDGWLARLTESGTPIWSRRYVRGGFNYTSFYDAIATSDGGTVAVGYATDVLGGTGLAITVGVLVRTDKYGSLLDSRTLDNSSQLKEVTIFNSVTALAGGGYLISGLQFERTNFQTRVIFVRVTDDFKIVWQTRINSPTFNFRLGFHNAMRQLTNGNVATGLLYDSEIASGRMQKVGFLFLHINPQTGQAVWLQPYLFHNKPATNFIATATIAQVYETNEGKTKWLLSYSDSVLITQRPYVANSAQLELDASGNLLSATAFVHNGPGSRAVGGLGNGNKPVWLMDDGNDALLVENEGATILRQQRYSLAASAPTALTGAADGGMYILGSGTTDNTLFTLTKTDPNLQVNCGMETAAVRSGDAWEAFKKEPSDFAVTVYSDLNFPLPVLPMRSLSEQLTEDDLCPVTCCRERKSVTELLVCGSKPATLPNGKKVDASGSYFEKITLASGCDSIAVYEVSNHPDASAIELDTAYCIDNGDTLQLHVPSGFDSYNWEGLNSTDSVATVRQPGNYRVTVSGKCGTATFAFRVQHECSAEVWLPNAFTPNGDGRNDVWRYPQANKQELVRLAVYNRWGSMVFQTSNPGFGWNGRSGGLALPAGVYVYVAEVKNRKGQYSMHKGTVTLIR